MVAEHVAQLVGLLHVPSICGPAIGARMRPAYQRSFTRLRHSCQSSRRRRSSARGCIAAAAADVDASSRPRRRCRPLVASSPVATRSRIASSSPATSSEQPGVALELRASAVAPLRELALQRAHLVGGRRRDRRVSDLRKRVEHDLRVARAGQAAAGVAHRRVLGPARRRGRSARASRSAERAFFRLLRASWIAVSRSCGVLGVAQAAAAARHAFQDQ